MTREHVLAPEPQGNGAKYSWGLMGIHEQLYWTAGDDPEGEKTAQVARAHSGHVFTLRLYKCNTCGYIELFDEEVMNGGA